MLYVQCVITNDNRTFLQGKTVSEEVLW